MASTPPVGIWFNYGIVNNFMHDWMEKKEKLRKGEITDEEYFELKICWPETNNKRFKIPEERIGSNE